MPNRQASPLLQNLIVPLRVRPPRPAIDRGVAAIASANNTTTVAHRRRRGREAAAVDFGDLRLVHHVEQAHLPLPLRSHQ